MHRSLRLLAPLATLFTLGFSSMAATPLIIGHRGASYDAPENTVPAFKLGYEQGADACELDTYLSQDGVAVVLHDETLKRTTGMEGKIREATVPALRLLDAGLWKGAQWRGTPVPTLAEALATIPPGKRMVIEIKDSAKVLPAVQKAIQETGKTKDDLILFGFKFETMVEARKLFPEIPLLWLAEYQKKGQTEPAKLEDLIARAKAAKFDGLSLQNKFPLDAAAVQKVHAAGLKLYVWTVDSASQGKQFRDAGVDGIVTNRPGWMREQLQ